MADTEFLEALRVNAAEVLDDLSSMERVQRFVATDAAMDRQIWAETGKLGWSMLAVLEEHGGMGGGAMELAVLQEAYGAHLTPLPSLGTALLTEAVKAWPDTALRSLLLPVLAAGGGAGGIADFDGAAPLHLTDGDTPRLDGETLVLDAIDAEWLLVHLTAEGGTGLAVLPRDAPGITITRRPVADRTRTIAALTCRATPVMPGWIMTGAAAHRLADRLRAVASLLIACDAIGGSRAALGITVDYLKTRIQFGKPIGAFQALKHRAADLKVKVEMARELVAAAMARIDDPDAALWASMAKFTACEAYSAVASEMVQMHGGIGFTAEHGAQLFLKRAGLDAALFGSAAIQQDRAAQLLIAKVA